MRKGNDKLNRRDWLRGAARTLAVTGIGAAAATLAWNRRLCRAAGAAVDPRLCAGCAGLRHCPLPSALTARTLFPGGVP